MNTSKILFVGTFLILLVFKLAGHSMSWLVVSAPLIILCLLTLMAAIFVAAKRRTLEIKIEDSLKELKENFKEKKSKKKKYEAE